VLPVEFAAREKISPVDGLGLVRKQVGPGYRLGHCPAVQYINLVVLRLLSLLLTELLAYNG
jgi:hypothetical protein